MGRNSATPELQSPAEVTATAAASTATATAGAGGGSNNGDVGFRSNHERLLFKRTQTHLPMNMSKSADRHYRPQFRSRRKAFFALKGNSMIYSVILLAVFGFAMASMMLQSSIMSVFRQGGERGRFLMRRRQGLKFGSSLEFVPAKRLEREGSRLDRVRTEARVAVRLPSIALILGNMKKNPESLMLFTVMKNLRQIGYTLKLYAVEDGEARTMWEQIGGHMSILNHERFGHLDWSLFEGVVADSLETKEIVSSLMQEPFCSVPFIWIIQEHTLANRLLHYSKMGWDHLISHWRSAFSRANAVVFSDYSFPMLYSVLDSGNFFVIPGSPIDVWAAENYVKSHSKHNLRKSHGYDADDLLVLVIGSLFFYDELSWDYAVAMHTVGPLLVKYAMRKDVGGSFKFIFLCGNSTDGYNDVLQDITRRLGLSPGSIKHHGMNSDVNALLLMADIVLYGSSQNEQGFPPLLTRAMSLGVPIIAPDVPVIKRYVLDGVHGMIFHKQNPDDLSRAFALLVSREGKLSKFAQEIGSSAKRIARNLLAFECITGYANLMENVLDFPSDVFLPAPVSQIQQDLWEWNIFEEATEETSTDMLNIDEEENTMESSSTVYVLEEDLNNFMNMKNVSGDSSEAVEEDLFTLEEWDAVKEIERSEEVERLEMDLIEERMEKYPGVWDEIYRNARKSEKLKFEANERDEGELERTGQPVCIYEIYDGSGAWPFLHHGSLYRGLSLATGALRLSSDDIDAISRLPLLNDSVNRDLLCEIGGMFSISYKVDEIHKRPWIGFQSWRASGRKVSLSVKAERALEETIQRQTKGDVMYFWTRLMDSRPAGNNDLLTFWSICDVLNGGHCRTAFENAFRHMYGLPANVEALPPMPEDGGYWSALHSWVMPTPSFLEFTMFSRMFIDSLDALNSYTNGSGQCLLAFSELEKKHCYCRVMELLVNVWAYHSARRMIYIDPHTGELEEQHPLDQRKGLMWVKYFDFPLLKRMDEDLAEASDDGDPPRELWLWPRTGEVHWQGIYEREREQRYRMKMDKKRKTKEKLLERQRDGYKQKALGG